MSNYTWSPTTGYIDNANVTRLARKHGLHGIDELRRRSVADPGWYWNAVLEDLGIEFSAVVGGMPLHEFAPLVIERTHLVKELARCRYP